MGVLTIEEQFNVAVTQQDLLDNGWHFPSKPGDVTYTKFIYVDLMDLHDMITSRSVFIAHYQINTGHLTIKPTGPEFLNMRYEIRYQTIDAYIHNIMELEMATCEAYVARQILNNPRYELRD